MLAAFRVRPVQSANRGLTQPLLSALPPPLHFPLTRLPLLHFPSSPLCVIALLPASLIPSFFFSFLSPPSSPRIRFAFPLLRLCLRPFNMAGAARGRGAAKRGRATRSPSVDEPSAAGGQGGEVEEEEDVRPSKRSRAAAEEEEEGQEEDSDEQLQVTLMQQQMDKVTDLMKVDDAHLRLTRLQLPSPLPPLTASPSARPPSHSASLLFRLSVCGAAEHEAERGGEVSEVCCTPSPPLPRLSPLGRLLLFSPVRTPDTSSIPCRLW